MKNNKLKDNIKLLCELPTVRLNNVLTNILYSKYGKERVVSTKDYIMAFSESPYCLVSHMDTVFKQHEDSKHPLEIEWLDDTEQCILWGCGGSGFDDRAGIGIIIDILTNTSFRPCIIFTNGEERGGIGAHSIVENFPICPFDNVKMLIELDRRGHNDCVFYDCSSEDFISYIETYGFEFAYGTFSDISIFMSQWRICGVNLSVGYMDEHTDRERLYYRSTEMTAGSVKKILETSNPPHFEYKEQVYDMNDRCLCCGKKIELNEVYSVFRDFAICEACTKKYY